MSGFATLNTAVSGLAAAQRAMDATSQNIVNATTPGYSRQRVLQHAVDAVPTATLHSGNGATFGGVQVTGVTRIKDAFLEATRAAAGARQATLSAQTDILSGVQLLLAEPGDTGLQSTLDTFYNRWHDLAGNHDDTAAAAVVVQTGLAVADQLHAVSSGIAAQWTTARDNLAEVVAQTNEAASNLATLNDSILSAQTAGKPVNELLDTRDTLIRKLSSLVGATSSQDDQGRTSVNINGLTIVSGQQWNPVSLTGANDLSTAATDPPTLQVGSFTVSAESGSAAGLLGVMRTDLPGLSAKVDAVAAGIIKTVNDLYATGHASDGSTGNVFFSGTDAGSIGVVPASDSPLAIAAEDGISDGSIAAKIGDLADDVISADANGGEPGPSAQWRTLTTATGTKLQSLNTANAVQDAVVSAADGAVLSDSGVNLDEEMTHMMLYQRSYQASARCITTVDDMLDTLINRTGLVGR